MIKSALPTGPTFVVRFWCEWSGAGRRWRGRVEEVRSGEGIAFLELQELVSFLQGRGVMMAERRAAVADAAE